MRGLREPRGSPDATGEDAEQYAEDALESQGVTILGSPVAGTAAYVKAKLQKTIDEARKYVAKAQATLLPVSTGASVGGESFSDEYLALMRTTLPGRFQHHLSAVTHPAIIEAAQAFDELQLHAYSTPIGPLHSDATRRCVQRGG